jgi:hypothetical protein
MEQDTTPYLGISFAWSDWDDFGIQQERHNMEQTLYSILYDHMNENEQMKKGETKMNAPQPKKFWMITGSGNMPKIRHQSMQDAQDEAKRLARANPGIEFYLLEAVEVFHQPTGVVRNRL